MPNVTDTPKSGTASVSRKKLEYLIAHLLDGEMLEGAPPNPDTILEELRAILAQPAGQQDELVYQARWCSLGQWGEWKTVSRDEYLRSDGRLFERRTLYRRPAAPAVKLPERLPGDDGVCTESHHAAGWNECRAETAKLNGIEP